MSSNRILMTHGAGGVMSRNLVRELFAKRLSNPALDEMGDSAIVSIPADRIALTTDAFVVKPLFFPGGDIGRLAVCGTINDLAVSGARPIALTASFIIEEGTPIELLEEIVDSMASTAREARVSVVAGDTKIVEKGRGDGVFITTSGVGEIIAKGTMRPANISAGDAIIINGPIADHGIAVMTAREGLTLESRIQSDCAPLSGLVERLLAEVPGVRFMRDPTRGGLAATLNEAVEGMSFGVEIDEASIPVRDATTAACEILGIDPLHVANEGKVVAFVAAEDSGRALAALRSHPLGREAVIIGRSTDDHAGKVAMKTIAGTHRIVSMPAGELLPRIC